MAYASSSRLSADLGRACVDKEGADMFLVARDRSRFPAHKAIISCRSPVLGKLLEDATAATIAAGECAENAPGSAVARPDSVGATAVCLFGAALWTFLVLFFIFIFIFIFYLCFVCVLCFKYTVPGMFFLFFGSVYFLR